MDAAPLRFASGWQFQRVGAVSSLGMAKSGIVNDVRLYCAHDDNRYLQSTSCTINSQLRVSRAVVSNSRCFGPRASVSVSDSAVRSRNRCVEVALAALHNSPSKM